jgi:hypothetical protein
MMKLFTNLNYTSALLGAISIITLVFQQEKANKDSNTAFLLGTCLLIGAAGFSIIELIVAIMLSFAYKSNNVIFNETKEKPVFPVFLKAPAVMVDLAVLQYFAGLVLCYASSCPSWWTVLVGVNLFIPFAVAVTVAVKASRGEINPDL